MKRKRVILKVWVILSIFTLNEHVPWSEEVIGSQPLMHLLV